MDDATADDRTDSEAAQTTAVPSPSVRTLEVQAARLLLDRLGISVDELARPTNPIALASSAQAAPIPSSGLATPLLWTGQSRQHAPTKMRSPLAPTFGDYVPRVAATVSEGARRIYSTYWQRIVEQWSHRRLDEPTATDIALFVEQAKAVTVARRNARGGRHAAEHMISALRCVYRHAIDGGILSESANPASRVAKPRRFPSTRHALTNAQLREISHVAATTGNDPALDSLLIRLHLETACRRGGALALRPEHLEPTR